MIFETTDDFGRSFKPAQQQVTPITKENTEAIARDSLQRRPALKRPAKSNKSDYLSERQDSKNRGSVGPLMTGIEFVVGVAH